MNDEINATENEAENREVWPRSLNKILVGLGVLAFGLVIADRLVDTFRAGDMPDVVQIADVQDVPVLATDDEAVKIERANSESEAATVVKNEEVLVPGNEVDTFVKALDVEEVFGSRLVFVSASQPMYVVTGDERRIGLGESIDGQTVLAGISDQQLLIEKDGYTVKVSLPEPDAK
ncbi:MAG: hypothetical protein AB8B87_19135 [Granulosicoccus sp.]